MSKRYRNQRALAAAFVRGATEGRASHMFIDGTTIYSYGYHFPIAIRGNWGCGVDFIFNTDTYSPTTAKQKSVARHAGCFSRTLSLSFEDIRKAGLWLRFDAFRIERITEYTYRVPRGRIDRTGQRIVLVTQDNRTVLVDHTGARQLSMFEGIVAQLAA